MSELHELVVRVLEEERMKGEAQARRLEGVPLPVIEEVAKHVCRVLERKVELDHAEAIVDVAEWSRCLGCDTFLPDGAEGVVRTEEGDFLCAPCDVATRENP